MRRSFFPYSKCGSSKGKGHPISFGDPKPAKLYIDFPEGGGYPKGFLEWAFCIMEVTNPDEVLHLCSGSVIVGITLDIRSREGVRIVADCRKTPLRDESFSFILADPPYSKEYAGNLYGTSEVYPKPSEICREASRLLRVGGKFGIMHFQVPIFRKPLKLINVWGVTQGLGFNIRAWSLFTKEPK